MGHKIPKWISEHAAELADTELFVFNVECQDGKKITVNLLNDVDIDFDMLENHLECIPAQYIFWSSVYSEAKHALTVMEKKLSLRRGVIAKTTVDMYVARGAKLTDKQLNSLVESDEQYLKLEMRIAVAQRNVGKLWHMVEAIRIRSEHCRSLSGFKRQEREQSGQQS